MRFCVHDLNPSNNVISSVKIYKDKNSNSYSISLCTWRGFLTSEQTSILKRDTSKVKVKTGINPESYTAVL